MLLWHRYLGSSQSDWNGPAKNPCSVFLLALSMWSHTVAAVIRPAFSHMAHSGCSANCANLTAFQRRVPYSLRQAKAWELRPLSTEELLRPFVIKPKNDTV